MKKLHLAWIAVAICIAACTDGDYALGDPLSTDVNVSQVTDQARIPIRFAPVDLTNAFTEDDVITRGTSSVSDLNIDDVGLFCLAKYSIEGISAVHTPSWSGLASAEINKYSIWKKNVKSTVIAKSKTTGDIVWDSDTLAEEYYPQTEFGEREWFAYGFVIYHPWTPYIVYTQKTVTAYIPVDGTQDVQYAIAVGPTVNTNNVTLNQSAFSANYYRGIDPDPVLYKYVFPSFKLQHLTCRLNFTVRLNKESSFNVHVEKIEFDDFPCIMKLGLASRSSGTMKSAIAKSPFVRNQGELDTTLVYTDKKKNKYTVPQLFPNITNAFGHFELREVNGDDISGQKNEDGSYKYNLSTEELAVGNGIMIPPVFKGHTRSTLNIYITIADDAGNKYKNTKPLKIAAPDAGWQKGMQHTINISLNPPLFSGNTVEIAGWSESETSFNKDNPIEWDNVTDE